MTIESADEEFRRGLLDSVRTLRAFAISLVGQVDRADDLVQETLTKAWAHRDSFQRGTNMRAWLFTVLRNEFYSNIRKRKREVEDVDGTIAASVAVPPGQQSHLDLNDMNRALSKLPDDQREALLLVTANDMSYEEAAQVCGVAVGTIKSRVNRARTALSKIMNISSSAEFGPDAHHSAAI